MTNQTEYSPETDPHIYIQLIFNKAVKVIQWGKRSLLNKWHRVNWIIGRKLIPTLVSCHIYKLI